MDKQQHLTDLRRKAEEQLSAVMSSLPDKSAEDIQTLVHDLHIHQIELTLQNEELRSTQAELEASRAQYADLYRKYANLYELAPVGYCTLDESGSILEMNLTAAKQLGIERADILNTRVYQYMREDDRDIFFAHLRAAFNTGSRQTCELRLRKQDGTLFWAQLEGIAVHADASTTNRCLTAITDISDCKHAEELLKIALGDKDMLMKEILHRTKNNMSTIINLLHLLALHHKENAQVVDIFHGIEHRIEAMLLVQWKLYESENFAHINLKEYLDELAQVVFYNLRFGEMRLALETEAVVTSPDLAISCGLLLNELLTNALKYAFPQAPASQPDLSAEIRVALHRIDAETVELRVSDNGVGLPEDFDLEHLDSLGLSLVTTFAQTLQGTFEVTSDHGTRWCIRFPQRS